MKRWTPILGYEGFYSINRRGQVLSHARRKTPGKGNYPRPALVMNPSLDGTFYYTVSLCKLGVRRTHKIHRLLAEAFIPRPSNTVEVNHKNGVRWDNRLRNLEWTTTSGNQLHRYHVLKKPAAFGERAPGAKLKNDEVKEIKFRLLRGDRQDGIAEDYGVHFATISAIHCGKSWRKC